MCSVRWSLCGCQSVQCFNELNRMIRILLNVAIGEYSSIAVVIVVSMVVVNNNNHNSSTVVVLLLLFNH